MIWDTEHPRDRLDALLQWIRRTRVVPGAEVDDAVMATLLHRRRSPLRRLGSWLIEPRVIRFRPVVLAAAVLVMVGVIGFIRKVRLQPEAMGAASALVTAASTSTETAVPLFFVARDEDGDRAPDLMGSTVTVHGVVSTRPFRVDGDRETRIYIEDRESGLRLATLNRRLLADLNPGDVVRAHGTVGMFYGMKVLEVDRVQRIGRGELSPAVDVTVADLSDDRYVGRRVRVRAQTEVPDRFSPSHRYVRLLDDTDEGWLHFHMYLATNLQLVTDLALSGRIDVIGILEEYGTRGADHFHRLLLTTPTDLLTATPRASLATPPAPPGR